MKTSIEKKLNFLTGYALTTTLLFIAFLSFSLVEKDGKKAEDEITVKRINIVGENGDLRMVISNKERQHSGRMNGKDYPKRERQSGMIFFNDEGDECGGFVYAGETKKGQISSGMSLTMDQYHQDQAIQILNAEEYSHGRNSIIRGISINDYPAGSNTDNFSKKYEQLKMIPDEKERDRKMAALEENEGAKNRLFIGRTKNNSSGLFLAGKDGKIKLKIYVDEKGLPKIEAINDKGETIDMFKK